MLANRPKPCLQIDVCEGQLFARQIDAASALAAKLDRYVDAQNFVRDVAADFTADVRVRDLARGANGGLANRALPARRLEPEIAGHRQIQRRLVGERRSRNGSSRCAL